MRIPTAATGNSRPEIRTCLHCLGGVPIFQQKKLGSNYLSEPVSAHVGVYGFGFFIVLSYVAVESQKVDGKFWPVLPRARRSTRNFHLAGHRPIRFLEPHMFTEYPAGGPRRLKPVRLEPKLETLNISDIRVDRGTQVRIKLNKEVIKEYAGLMQEGVKFPPELVYRVGAELLLSDGGHRLEAKKLCGLKTTIAEVRIGTRADAIVAGIETNGRNGIRFSNADKRNAVLMVLNECRDVEFSARRVAKMCGVSHQLVADIRAQLSKSDSSQTPAKRVGIDGKSRKMPRKHPDTGPSPAPHEEPQAAQAEAGGEPTASWIEQMRKSLDALWRKLEPPEKQRFIGELSARLGYYFRCLDKADFSDEALYQRLAVYFDAISQPDQDNVPGVTVPNTQKNSNEQEVLAAHKALAPNLKRQRGGVSTARIAKRVGLKSRASSWGDKMEFLRRHAKAFLAAGDNLEADWLRLAAEMKNAGLYSRKSTLGEIAARLPALVHRLRAVNKQC